MEGIRTVEEKDLYRNCQQRQVFKMLDVPRLIQFLLNVFFNLVFRLLRFLFPTAFLRH